MAMRRASSVDINRDVPQAKGAEVSLEGTAMEMRENRRGVDSISEKYFFFTKLECLPSVLYTVTIIVLCFWPPSTRAGTGAGPITG